MKENFDLNIVGKKTPYEIPDSFLDEFTYKVVRKSETEKRKNSVKIMFWQISFAAASLLLMIFTGLHFIKDSEVKGEYINDTNVVETINVLKNNSPEVESVIKELSDEELKVMSSMIETDVFTQQ